jgi:very-short-patch-repair endonuclease
MGNKLDMLDARVAEFAAWQHGIVTLRQLEAAGLSRRAVTGRVHSGRLHRLHRGIYAVGHRAPSHRARFMAAVLACGEDAVLSHVSAAVLWELLRPLDGPVHVSVPTTSGRRSRRGIRLHRCPSLATPREPSPSPSYLHQEGGRGRRLITRRHNIPVTIIPRTIEDLRRTELLPPHLLRRAIRQAELKGHHLAGVESDRTRSDLERLFLAVIHPHRDRIPHPEVNVKIGRWTVDFLWRRQRVVVETDFWTYHRGSVAWQDDHARDLDLRSAGYIVLRFTDEQLEKEPGRVVADVARALEQEDRYSGR